jgi:hypothetical protein
MRKHILKIKQKPWDEYQRKQAHRQNRSGIEVKEVPMPIYYGGTQLIFNPTCAVSESTAKGLLKRANGTLVEHIGYEETPLNPRANPDGKFLCSFCDRGFDKAQGRNVHESRFCKEKEND